MFKCVLSFVLLLLTACGGGAPHRVSLWNFLAADNGASTEVYAVTLLYETFICGDSDMLEGQENPYHRYHLSALLVVRPSQKQEGHRHLTLFFGGLGGQNDYPDVNLSSSEFSATRLEVGNEFFPTTSETFVGGFWGDGLGGEYVRAKLLVTQMNQSNEILCTIHQRVVGARIR